MVHGVRLTDGRAEWYRNRWVRTPVLDGVPFRRNASPTTPAPPPPTSSSTAAATSP